MNQNNEKKITYVGWVGYDNLGDEALYEINKSIFHEYQLVHDNKKHHSKITLFGGGTALPNWPSFIMENKYNYAFGVGVRDPAFWGEFPPFTINRMKKFNFRSLGVRGERSRKLLESWGVKSQVVGDPCLLFETEQTKREEKKVIVNVDYVIKLWGENEKHVFSTLSKLCVKLKEEEYDPVLLPMWDKSVPFVKEVAKRSDTPIFKDWRKTHQVLKLMTSSKIVIGEKLHAIVFSAVTHTPFITIEYRPKCREFAELMGLNKHIIRTDQFTIKKTTQVLHDAVNDWKKLNKQLKERVKIYKKKLRKFAVEIKEDIDSLPEDKWTPSRLQNIKSVFSPVKKMLWKRQTRRWERSR